MVLVKLLGWSCLCAALVACHAAPGPREPAGAPTAHVAHSVQAGMQVARLERTTPGLVRLALYLDAGSRDVSPPQVATVAAWLAAERGGPRVSALVFPDFTELARTCEADQLAPCTAELARALGTRSADAAGVARARSTLADTRRRALAADPAREVEALALRSLLGEQGPGFFPLGNAADDEALGAAAVEAMLRAHYGPSRALLVAAGDIAPDALASAISSSFSALPAATALRQERVLDVAEQAQLSIAIDDRGALGLALTGPSEVALNAIAAELSDVLEAASARASLPATQRAAALDAPGSRVRGHVFAARGGALALLRVEGDPQLGLPLATRELSRLQHEQPRPRPAPPSAGDLASLSRELGQRFGAQAEPGSVERPLAFGVGLTLRGAAGAGPRAGTRVQDAVEPSEQAGRELAMRTFERARAGAEPRMRGDSDERSAALVTDNGAHIDVQSAPGSELAIAVRIALGADQDPPLEHGRSALLATLTTTACNGLGPERLRAELSQLGATLEPRVDAESFGLSLRAPAERWREALDLAVRCARTPTLDSVHFADAALRLQARLGPRGSSLRLRARAAAEVAPRAPGLCAPWGEPGRLGNLAPADLGPALKDSQSGTRWSVALVGPVPVEEASAYIARRLADLPAGAPPKAAQPGHAETGAARSLTGTPSESSTLLLTWGVQGRFAHRLGAGVFASALHAVLSMVDGVEVLWQDADVFPGGAFAALELRASAAMLPQLPELLARASGRLTVDALDEALSSALALATLDGRSAEAEPAVRAERLARRRLGALIELPEREDARKLIDALRRAPARLALLR